MTPATISSIPSVFFVCAKPEAHHRFLTILLWYHWDSLGNAILLLNFSEVNVSISFPVGRVK